MPRKHDLQNIITYPPHYIEGRYIEPITVIEEFGLCHHLACVVNYIARAGRKNPILEDLMKAEWYLERVLSNENAYCQNELRPQQMPSALIETPLLQKICDDWQLSDSLCGAILNIFISVELPSHESKQKALKTALDCLREEIAVQEVSHDLGLLVNVGSESRAALDNRENLTLKMIGKDQPFQFSKKKTRVG